MGNSPSQSMKWTFPGCDQLHAKLEDHRRRLSLRRQSNSTNPKATEELITWEFHEMGHHGLPYNCKKLAVDHTQGLLVLGSASGMLKVFGQPGVERVLQFPQQVGESLAVAVQHLACMSTPRSQLVSITSDSAIRFWDLSKVDLQDSSPLPNSTWFRDIPATWTTFVVTALSVSAYGAKFQYVYVATDDGVVHVIDSVKCHVCDYTIAPHDTGIIEMEKTTKDFYISAIAICPIDENQILIGYSSGNIILWDITKRRVLRSFHLNTEEMITESSLMCLSWHASGKRFVAGYNSGILAFFRTDKKVGTIYRLTEKTPLHPVCKVVWYSNPSKKKGEHLEMILFSGGLSSEGCDAVSILFENQTSANEEIKLLSSSEETSEWLRYSSLVSFGSIVMDFGIVCDDKKQNTDDISLFVPTSIFILEGNPLNGRAPVVTHSPIPANIMLNREDSWVKKSAVKPQPCLHTSDIVVSTVVEIWQDDGSLVRDLLESFAQFSSGDSQQPVEWPMEGGHLIYSSRQPGISTEEGMKTTLYLTGHVNGDVLIWECMQPPSYSSSKGTMRLLHQVHIPSFLENPATSADATTASTTTTTTSTTTADVNDDFDSSSAVTAIRFCPGSRTLVAGLKSGELVVLRFWKLSEEVDEPFTTTVTTAVHVINEEHFSLDETNEKTSEPKNGEGDTNEGNDSSSVVPQPSCFHCIGCYVMHASDIVHLEFTSQYGYLAASDSFGVVSLTNVTTGAYSLIVFEMSLDETASISSLCMAEIAELNLRQRLGGINTTYRTPLLFVGRGTGKIELFSILTGIKMAEYHLQQEIDEAIQAPTHLRVIDLDGRLCTIKAAPWSPERRDVPKTSCTLPDLPADTKTSYASGTSEAFSRSSSSLELHPLKKRNDSLNDVDTATIHPHNLSPKTNDAFCLADQMKILLQKPSAHVELSFSPGPIGLNFRADIDDYAVVQDITQDKSQASQELPPSSIYPGSVLLSINGVNITGRRRSEIETHLKALIAHPKTLLFADGRDLFAPFISNEKDKISNKTNASTLSLLVATFGNRLVLFPVILPSASELALGNAILKPPTLAKQVLPASAVAVGLLRVPGDERLESVLACADKSGTVSMFSLLTLEFMWRCQLNNIVQALDFRNMHVTSSSELFLCSSSKEVLRFSFLSEQKYKEETCFQKKTCTMNIYSPERECNYYFDHSEYENRKSTATASSKTSISNASKLFKKLVGQKSIDLDDVFHSESEAAQRGRLLGDAAERQEKNSTNNMEKTVSGVQATKNALNKAAEHLNERGEKLSQLAEKSEQLKDTSEEFYQTMKAFNDKNASKKWWQI